MTDLMKEHKNGQQLVDRPTAELVKMASEQVSHLIRAELRLAQAELTAKGRHAGIGVGMFGGAGLVALYGVGALLACFVLLLALVMPAWLAALIVAVMLLVIAGVLALFGRGQVKQATPAMPEQTVDSVKEDIETVTGAVRERGRR